MLIYFSVLGILNIKNDEPFAAVILRTLYDLPILLQAMDLFHVYQLPKSVQKKFIMKRDTSFIASVFFSSSYTHFL